MRLQLSLAAEDLPKSLVGGTPDPFAVVTMMTAGNKPTVLGQTEVLTNTDSPDWTKLFYIEDFELGKPCNMIVSIYSSQQKKKPLGSTVWEVGSILGAPGSRLAKRLKDGGVLIAHVEEATAAGTLRFQLRGLDFTNTEGGGIWNKSDPFFELQRLHVHSRVFDTVFRSATVSNNLHPVWGESFVEVHALCGGQRQQKFRLVVYDHDANGQHDKMGHVLLTVDDLLGAVNETALKEDRNEINADSAFGLSKGAGKILVAAAEITGAVEDQVVALEPVEPPTELDVVVAAEETVSGETSAATVPVALQDEDIDVVQPTFVSYISGGCELRVVVAIDATASNGDPRKEESLHHFKSDGKNTYEQVMFSLCSILSKYDSDQKYPVYGFGAKRNGSISHCFPIGSSGAEVDGVDGILKAYKESFRSGLIMSSPRDFSDVIQKATKDANDQLVSAH